MPIAPPKTEDELILEEPGRDLRPDTITPSPDVTSTGAAAAEHLTEVGEEILAEVSSTGSFASPEEIASEARASEAKPAPESVEDAAQGGSSDEDEKQDASPDAAN